MPASATFSGNALLRPALDALEGRTGDADQVAVVLSAEIRFEIAAVGFDIDHCLIAFPAPGAGRAASDSGSTCSISADSGATTDARPPVASDRGGAAELRLHAAHQAFDHVDVSPEQSRIAWRRRCWCQSRAAVSARRCAAVSPRVETRLRRTACGPGQMTPPRYSPFADTASNVVAVPKSTTIIGRPLPYVANAAMLLTTRSAPTSRGVVDQDRDAAVHAPARTAAARGRNSRVTIVISVPVSGGTTDAMTMPEMSVWRISLRSHRLLTRMPSSSDVRSRIVVRRQV